MKVFKYFGIVLAIVAILYGLSYFTASVEENAQLEMWEFVTDHNYGVYEIGTNFDDLPDIKK